MKLDYLYSPVALVAPLVRLNKNIRLKRTKIKLEILGL